MQYSSGQPGTASASLCCRTSCSLSSLTPFHHLSQSKTGTVLLTLYWSQIPTQLSDPDVLLISHCPKPHGPGFWNKCYCPIVLSHLQGWDYHIVLAKNKYLFKQICLRLAKPVWLRMKIPSTRKILKLRRNIREPAGWHRAQKLFHKSQGLPLFRSTLHLAFSGADSEEIWEKPSPKLPTLSLLVSANCWQILPQWERKKACDEPSELNNWLSHNGSSKTDP